MSSAIFLYPLKTSGKPRFSDIFRGYENMKLAITGFKEQLLEVLFIYLFIYLVSYLFIHLFIYLLIYVRFELYTAY